MTRITDFKANSDEDWRLPNGADPLIDGYMMLVAAILREAIEDVQTGDAEALEWLAGDACAHYCTLVGLDPVYMRRRAMAEYGTRRDARANLSSVTVDDLRDAYADYQRGITTPTLANRLGIDDETLRARWRKMGLRVRPQKRIGDERARALYAEYKAGALESALCRREGFATGSLGNKWRSMGLTLERRSGAVGWNQPVR